MKNRIKRLINIFRQNKDVPSEKSHKDNFSPKALYQTYDLTALDMTLVLMDILKPAQAFVRNVSLDFCPDEQCIYAKVELGSFFRPFSFHAKVRLVDIWQDIWTSTAVFELTEINVHIISLLPKAIRYWCGQKLISIISFWGSFFQKGKYLKAHFYLQEQLLYIDFRPWILQCIDGRDFAKKPEAPHRLSSLFGTGKSAQREKYMRSHIIFGAEIIDKPPLMRLYLYHIPSARYKDADFDPESSSYKTGLSSNWLEWVFAIATSFLLVSFLVPFGMAYVKLAPFESADLFSLPFIFIYNTLIVLIPFVIFRIVLMPMRRVWASRHGRIEILQAEVARDQVFMPLLREWIVLLQTLEGIPFPHSLLKKIRSFLIKIGVQKYWLVDKISLIEKRRRIYAKIIALSYVGVCLIEALFLTGAMPTPQFLANSANKLLELIFLQR
ncbi:MAG: hypothetical protein LBO03_02105 [Acidaminococcales bacterium]|jgi:hypothetical protein|nr:hypothetical protein [Acidaminococcales bacterium]